MIMSKRYFSFLLFIIVFLPSCDLFGDKPKDKIELLNKDDFIKVLSCSSKSSEVSKVDKDYLLNTLSSIEKISNADWNTKNDQYKILFDRFKKYCDEFYKIDYSNSFKLNKCSDEGTIKSVDSIKKLKISFKNSFSKKIKVTWLDFNGNRDFRKENTEIIEPSTQGKTFVTYLSHPYVITDENDKCLNIYTPKEDGIIEVK